MDDGLELSPELLSAWTRAIDERLGTFLRELSSSPAASHDPPSRGAQEELRKAAPEQGSSLETILDFLFREIIPPSLNTAGPGYLAYVPGGGLPSAALAEYIAAIVNRYTGVWAAAPAAVELETQAIRWLAELLGMAPGSLGVMTTGGSISNLIAVIAAREKLLGRSIERGTIYVSQEVHHSLLKAARTAGIPPENVRSIPVDDTFRMAIDPLVEQIRADRTAGFLPFFVCASAGTVNTGAMDPIDAIADVAEEEGIWLHVDGAYGGFFRLVPELAPLFRGVERADSFAVDPHKGLFLAYGTGLLLARDVEDLRGAFGGAAAYLPRMQSGSEHLDFCELTPELSRDWRGLRLWLPFKLHGVSAFRDALREKRALTLRAFETLSAEPDVDIAAPPELSLFAFRQRLPARGRDEENLHNRALLDRINARGRIYLTGTTLRGELWLRFIVLHLRTHADRVDEGVAIIQEELARARGR